MAASSETSTFIPSPQSISLTPLETSPTILTVNGVSGGGCGAVVGTVSGIGNSGNTIVVSGGCSNANETIIQEVIIISQNSPHQQQQHPQQQQHQQQQQQLQTQQQTIALNPVVRDISSTGGVMTG